MELTAEQEDKFKELCKEIKPGEYGRVVVSFTGESSNVVTITSEKNVRFEKAKPHTQPTGTAKGGSATGRK